MPLFFALGAIAMLKMENVSSLAEKTCFVRPRSDFFSGARWAHVPEDCSRCVRHGFYVANVSPDSAAIKGLNLEKSYTVFCYQNQCALYLSIVSSVKRLCPPTFFPSSHTNRLFSFFHLRAKHCQSFFARALCNPPSPPDALLHMSKSHLPSSYYMYFIIIFVLEGSRQWKTIWSPVSDEFRVSKRTK